MRLFLVFTVLFATCLAIPMPQFYSYSPAVGGGSGTSYATSGEGRITAVRVWENVNSYIYGFQLRYGYVWTPVIGRNIGTEQIMILFDDEAIVQVSGKYTSNYIYKLVFVTNKGRSLEVGHSNGNSFNFYPVHENSELRLLSGRFNSAGITSIGAHWGMVYTEQGGNDTVGHLGSPVLN